jgi:hypothetical protein
VFACLCIALAVFGEAWVGGIAVILIPVGFAFAMLLSAVRLMWLFAREAVLTPEGVEARTYLGRAVIAPWRSVESVARLRVKTFGSSQRIRMTFQQGAPLLIADLTPDWDMLLQALDQYVPEQKWTREPGR